MEILETLTMLFALEHNVETLKDKQLAGLTILEHNLRPGCNVISIIVCQTASSRLLSFVPTWCFSITNIEMFPLCNIDAVLCSSTYWAVCLSSLVLMLKVSRCSMPIPLN